MLNMSLTVAKVAGGVVVKPAGVHATVPPVPPVPVGMSSRWPGQPARGDNNTSAAADGDIRKAEFHT